MPQNLKIDLDSRGVASVTLNRPDVRNAFNEGVIRDLTEWFSEGALDPWVRIVVLRGEGAVFCAGGDLNWMRRSVEVAHEENLEDTRALARMFGLLNECPKPVIGAIQGAAIGGGVGLVSVCDVAIASSEAAFSLSEVRLGIVPACIGPFVIAKIGASHARSLFLSAERFSAARAREIGLVHEVVSAPSDLDSAVERQVGQMLQCGPNAMAVAKRLVLDLSWPERRARHPDPLDYVAKALADVRVTPEAQEGVTAFLEKRSPAWLNAKGGGG